MYNDYFIPHFDNDPRCLQHKVYFDIAFFLGKRAKEGLRELKIDSFTLKTNAQGRDYLELNYNESTKKSPGDDFNEMNEQPILLSQPNDRRCPVNSFQLYKSKLTEIEDLFQSPNDKLKIQGKWYKKSPVGENTIAKFMKEISKNAGLSRIYTNHCIRGTTATAMHRSGYSLHDIAQVTRHKNIESIKFYLQTPTIEDMENYSNSLFDYANDSSKQVQQDAEAKKTTEESDQEFEEPPQPTRNMYEMVTKKKDPTKSTNNTEMVPITNDNNDEVAVPTSTTSNVMQMYRQNPIGMFVGANLNNCTININMPK